MSLNVGFISKLNCSWKNKFHVEIEDSLMFKLVNVGGENNAQRKTKKCVC